MGVKWLRVAMGAAAGRPPKPREFIRGPYGEFQTLLEYMLAVMRDATVDAWRRDRMAMAAAPYVHPKAGEIGKKEAAKKAAKKATETAGTGTEWAGILQAVN